ncbi:MAG: protein kinase [Cyanobacteria bacterium J06632_3]
MVSFKNNQIKVVEGDALGPTVRWLILTNNQIGLLPAEMGKLSRLQKLMLAGNRLRSLPPELSQCRNLELIRMSANDMHTFPRWLLSLPKLSWLAFAGNPYCQAETNKRQALPLKTFLSDEINQGEQLGQGASGVIYKGNYKGMGQGEAIAIKRFKGDITSDGSPLDERAACIAAGTHPNLVNVLGEYEPAEKHTGKADLVFDFIGEEYENLGGPPSLESCTRDIYPEDASFSVQEILTISAGIASAAQHLHQRGIMHGDLYAHNILVNPKSHSILGDFGAASFYDETDKDFGQALERIEVRAFGCLLEDLLDRCLKNAEHTVEKTVYHQLRQLQQACMAPEANQRPRFRSICQTLSTLSVSVCSPA